MSIRYLHASVWMAVGVLVWCGTAQDMEAQYYYVTPATAARPAVAPAVAPPAVNPYGYGYPVAGGYWQGQAAAIDAYANLGVSMEQAKVINEQANQAKLDTKKKTIDTMEYERAHKYWYSDEQADIQAKRVQAAMNNPPTGEITNGKALNILLPFLDKLLSSGYRGPSMPIDPFIVRSLNVTSGSDNGSVGMLKELNTLQWPLALQGPTQKNLDALLKQATYDSTKGPVPLEAIRQIGTATDNLAADLKKRFYKDDVDAADYVEANRFLDRVRESTKALKQPNVGSMLTGASGPQGNTVEQVVYSMASKGLTFAPAQPGQESAYIALHRSFVNFALAADTTDTGFRVALSGKAGVTAAKGTK